MKIGYARVSRPEQSLDSQIDALKDAGCVRIFSEHVSGRKAKMPEFEACMQFLRAGDTLVVRHIDRLNRGTLQLMQLYEDLQKKGIFLFSTSQPIDTKDRTLGPLLFQILSVFAESEHNLIKERSKQGLLAARARGTRMGRMPKLDPDELNVLIESYRSRKYTIKQLCKMFNLCKASVMNLTKCVREEEELCSTQSA